MNRLAASLDRLNEGQRRAVMHGPEPLLVIAGAGTGKTTTLAHRVARLIDEGANPARILLLTFARRAAAEMLRRVDALLGRDGSGGATAARVWGGTFHAIGARLLRLHGAAIGVPPDFTVLDRADAEDLLDVVRTELGLGATDRSDSKRFPRKGTALAIYSRCVNARTPLEELLARQYPWCRDAAEDLKRLFRAFGDRKAEQAVLDYDDLLLWLHALLADPVAGEAVRARFDRVLVDEYQDTNRLQAEIVKLLRPGGDGLTVVGDDAQSIYSFRGATVRNILDFPREWPGGAVVKLEDNYRSTPQLVEATNRIIGCAPAGARFEKTLRSPRRDGPRPLLVTCFDEDEQTAFVVRTILEQREAGVALRRQAVLFRAAHHSTSLELELGRRNVPFHKYGGLKFLEAAHVKDVVGFLRLIENPRDLVAGTRTLQLLPGVGPKRARALMDAVAERSPASFEPWREGRPHSESWAGFVDLVRELSGPAPPELPAQLHRIRAFYAPLVERRFDDLDARLRDLEQLEQLAARYADRRQFLAEMALDPPSSTQDL